MSLAESTINGYHPPLRLDRSAQGGGVAVWIKENLAYEQLSTIDCGDHEIIWLSVNLQGRKKLVLGGLYRPWSAPGHDISILEHLDTSLDHVRSFGTNVMLAGEFNVLNGPWLGSSKTTRAGEYLEEICAVHGLVQHVKTATRDNNPLDLILSDLGDRVSVDVTSPIGISDHSVLLTKIATCPQREKRTARRVWRYSKADWGRLGKFYHDVEWSKIISSDPNLACKGVTETILDGMHRHIPNKRLTTRPSDPSWWTPECTAAVQAKRRSWDRLHTYPSKENEDLYKTHCARCVACLHNAKERGLAAVRQRLKSGSLQDKQWWSTLKAAGGDGRQCTIPVIRDDKGSEHTTSMDKASCFGRHFSAKCSVKEDLHQSDLPHFPRRCDTVLSQVRFRTTTVRRYLKGLDVSKATGPDGIPARVLKQCAAELSQPLSQLFSLCFQHGTQPSMWKTANVVPIHKKRSRTAVQNYRPVSLLSVLSKVMEKVVNRRIMTYLEKENLLSKHQFGFRTGLGTADLLTSLNHQWLSCINTGGAVRVLAVDIAGAFDRVSHLGVLHKIRSYGLGDTLHRWLTSYLTDRNPQVVVGGATSQPFPIAAGVPKGSILGPTLFLLYVNDAADVLPDGVSPATYADDTTLYSTMSSMETATATCQTFQTGVNKLAQWGATWRIQFEPSKAVFVLYLFRFRNINQGWNTRSFCVNRNRNTIPVSVDKPAQGWFIKPKPVYVCARRQQKWMGRVLHVCTKIALYKDRVTMNFFCAFFLVCRFSLVLNIRSLAWKSSSLHRALHTFLKITWVVERARSKRSQTDRNVSWFPRSQMATSNCFSTGTLSLPGQSPACTNPGSVPNCWTISSTVPRDNLKWLRKSSTTSRGTVVRK